MAMPHPNHRVPAAGEDTFLKSSWPAICNSARRSNPEDSDDLVQDVGVKLLLAYRSRARQRRQPTNFTLIITNAIRTSHRDRMRRAGVEQACDSSELETMAVAANDDREPEPASVHRRLDEVLSGRLREVFDCLYVHELSQREAAARMRLSQPRIAQLHKELIARGRAALGLGSS